MIEKIGIIINISMIPFKNLKFYGQGEIIDTLVGPRRSKIAKRDRYTASSKLRKKIYDEIIIKSKPNSLDEINLLLQKFYPMFTNDDFATRYGFFDDDNINNHESVEIRLYKHYFCILEEFSNALISYRDGDVIFKYWTNDVNRSKKWNYIDFMNQYKGQEKVHFFQAFSRVIPLDLMVALHNSKNNIHEPIQLHEHYQHINLADAPLDDILSRGVAENHIHATAAFNFTILWQMIMNNKSTNGYLEKFDTNHLATTIEVERYILTAQLLRKIMNLYLNHLESKNIVPVNPNNGDTIPSVTEWLRIYFENDTDTMSLLNKFIISRNNSFESKEILNALIEKIDISFMDKITNSDTEFIMSIFSKHKNIKTYGENLFLHKAMTFKRSTENNHDNQFAFGQFFSIFFKYISIKNEFYQQVTQPTMLNGLDFFRRYFHAATSGISKRNEYFLVMLRTLFQNRYLSKIELRMSIHDNTYKNKQNLLNILKSYEIILEEDYKVKEDPNVEFPLIGIVYHLLKLPDNTEKDFTLYDEERDHTLKYIHFGELQEKYIKQVEMVQKLRKNVPMTTNFIVGLDAASLENHTPVQVFAPVFEEARDSQYDTLKIIDPEGNVLPNQSLFFTFHAGEEFRHIFSGLRRMDEVIDYCKLHAGDRIGHGIALGVDIKEWSSRNPIVIIPRGEYLDNLLWIWGVYSRTINLQTETLVYLERRIYDIAKEIFSDIVSLEVIQIPLLFDTYKRRFKRIKEEISRRQNGNEKSHSSELLFQSYHKEETLIKMEEPIYVSVNKTEQQIARDMQKYLIEKIAVTGIVIEVNPSSNEAIGEIDSLFGNQLFKIQSANNEDLANILVNVNSDDPLVFNTNVSNELVYIYYGMLEQGMGREAALEWIDKLRRSGMETSFIRGIRSRKEYLRILKLTIAALQDAEYC